MADDEYLAEKAEAALLGVELYQLPKDIWHEQGGKWCVVKDNANILFMLGERNWCRDTPREVLDVYIDLTINRKPIIRHTMCGIR